MPLGSLTLLVGREGIGKSTAAYTLAADITRGRLRGEYFGQPKSVLVVATEDSWSHTMVPRLVAADADLSRIFRVSVNISEGPLEVSLPADLPALEEQVLATDAALIVLDPLTSRLDARLDTHKDAEVRLALEPLVASVDRVNASALGIIHVNQTSSTDALNLIMGSRAFSGVPRAVLFAMRDPKNEAERALGQPKNNLGRDGLPTLRYRIEGVTVGQDDDGADIVTGKLVWLGESHQTVTEMLEESADPKLASAVDEAAEWLRDYLVSHGSGAESAEIKVAGTAAGHAERTLHRARALLGVTIEPIQGAYPARSYWTLPTKEAA